MRILVTGANGLVGSRLCRRLASAGHHVVGLGRGDRRVNGAFEYVTCELTSAQEVERGFEIARPEAVIHTASMTEVDACEREPELAYRLNVEATSHVALASRKTRAHLVHVSTDYVFDGDHGPYSEEDLPNPRGVYALTKHLGEQTVRALAPSWAVARTAVVYGWPQAARPNFGAWLVSALGKGQQVRLFEDQFVAPSLADNVAAMLAELAERKLTGLWNTCGAEVVDRVTFGRALCERFGFDPALITPVKMRELNLASPRPLNSGLRSDKAASAFSGDARPLGLSESLARFHAAFAEEQDS
ncbi:MAG: SDR family oxidoreductase [Myxococcaceae bacterium]